MWESLRDLTDTANAVFGQPVFWRGIGTGEKTTASILVVYWDRKTERSLGHRENIRSLPYGEQIRRDSLLYKEQVKTGFPLSVWGASWGISDESRVLLSWISLFPQFKQERSVTELSINKFRYNGNIPYF